MKGQESIASFVIILLVLIASGGLIKVNESTLETKDSNTGDYNTIIDADIKSDYYPYLLRKELNYSSNNLAIETTVWNDEVPGYDKARKNYRESLKQRVEEQTDLIGCTPPKISKIKIESVNNFTTVLGSSNITCTSRNTVTKIPIDKETNITVNNTKNRYNEALNYTTNYTRNLDDSISGNSTAPGKDYDVTGTATTSCEDPDRSRTRKQAVDNAENNAEQEARRDGEDEIRDDDEIDNWVNIELGLDALGECRPMDEESSSCTYRECEGQGEDRECEDESGTEYTYTCNWKTDEMVFSIEVLDYEYKLKTKKGVSNPVFKWEFRFET